MITALASSSSPKKTNGEAMLLHPVLLMAARQGESELLDNLLNNQDAVAIDINNMNSSSANEGTVMTAASTIVIDSILHVVASSGDGDVFLKSADVIYAKAKDLLGARNGNGDTPLQCATRAGNARMVSHLMGLAKCQDGGDAKLKEILRNQNEQGETALHDAIRLGDKGVLEMVQTLLQLGDDDGDDDVDVAELAFLDSFNGTSPLYLAVMLGHDAAAKILYRTAAYKEGQRQLSYSGPDGQNALHAAVLRSYGAYC